jgi:molecular chaperone GrpE (heat shock protein)
MKTKQSQKTQQPVQEPVQEQPIDDFKNKYLRALADYQNLEKSLGL